MIVANRPAASGTLFVAKTFDAEAIRRRFVRDDVHGAYLPGRAALLYENKEWDDPWQKKLLVWLRDHINAEIPRAYYKAMLGHDLHLSVYAQLFVRHFHARQPNPWTGELGWLENVGMVSQGKVTTAFRDYLTGNFVTDLTTIGDFKFHRPGLSATAEANTDTALVTDAGLEATGNQTNPTANTYQSVGTVTADVTETWQEHSIRNATGAAGGTMMDRSLISPTAAVVASDTVQFTYVLTENAEA